MQGEIEARESAGSLQRELWKISAEVEGVRQLLEDEEGRGRAKEAALAEAKEACGNLERAVEAEEAKAEEAVRKLQQVLGQYRAS